MALYDQAAHIADRCNGLKTTWRGRNKKFGEWYDLLALYDELYQQGMESVVINDPRTFFNTALYLLTPRIPHRIPVQGLDREAMAWVSSLERTISASWADLNYQYRRRGRKSWLNYTTGLMLATGWYAVLCMAARDKLIAETWNPAEVFPEYDGKGLSAVAHVFTVSADQAEAFYQDRGWVIPTAGIKQDITVNDLWEVREGRVINVTEANNQIVKERTEEPFVEIPVLVGPAGGLPDDGPISQLRQRTDKSAWREHMGESILATNEPVYKNQNRQLTFMQQILRDTAQPKFWEKSRGGAILKPEDLTKRGAIFRLAEGEDVGTIQMPGIPVELSILKQSYEEMIQRGSVPHALAGQVQNIPIGLMSQVAAAAVQVLSLYHDAVMGLLTDIDNIWARGIHDGTYNAPGATVPDGVPLETLRFEVEYPINIPGDLVQRATILRMVAPSARMSSTTGLDLFFPEIKDPARELSMARVDDAYNHPMWGTLSLISSLKQEAMALRRTGSNNEAMLLEKAAQALEAQIMGGGEQQLALPMGADGAEAGGIPPRGMDPNMQAMLQQLVGQVEGNNAGTR